MKLIKYVHLMVLMNTQPMYDMPATKRRELLLAHSWPWLHRGNHRPAVIIYAYRSTRDKQFESEISFVRRGELTTQKIFLCRRYMWKSDCATRTAVK